MEVKVPVIIFHNGSHLEGPEVFALNSDLAMDRLIDELRRFTNEGEHRIEKAFWTEKQLKESQKE